MKQKICNLGILLLILTFVFPMSVSAKSGDHPAFGFELSVDGSDTKEVETGDVITVILKLKRTDSDETYTMYAMQDEIRYDSSFFELVEGSEMLSAGIVSTDIELVDQHREFYMNYLSMSGGNQWNADELIGSFQLKVIGKSGVSKITNQDYLVSFEDGSGSYACKANDLTIVLSTDCTVKFHTNGGTELSEQLVQYGEKIERPEDPVREGYELEGWYTDIHLTDEWDFENDLVQGNMSLYAKWIEASPGICWWWLLLLLLLILVIWVICRKKIKRNKNREL